MAGWQTKAIGEVFRVVNGGTPKTGTAAFWDGPHQWITPAEMGGLPSPYLAGSRRTLTDEGLRVGAELVPPQSVILSSRAPIGHLVINEVPMAFNQGCKGLVPSPAIDTKFAYYFLLANVPLLESLGTGATFKELSSGKLKEVPFHFPPLPEQRRIVAILDEAFEAIATAKANTEKNLQNARELFTSRVKSTFASPGDGWVECTLGSVCEMYQPKTITGKELVADGPYPVFGANGVIGRYTAYNHEEAEVLVTCRGATCGAINVSEPRSWVTGNAMVVRPLHGTLDKSFLEHMLRNGVDLSPAITGAAQPQITRTNLAPLVISFPKGIDDQRNLAVAFEELQAAAAGLQDIHSRKLAALDELKKSLLHRAFTGQLTAKVTDKQLAEVA